MKVRNRHFYNKDQQVLADLRVEYELLGFRTEIEPGHLTVFALTKKKKDKKKDRKDKE